MARKRIPRSNREKNRKYFDQNYKAIYAAASKYPHRDYDLDDWCQMCILKILDVLHTYNKDKLSFSSWAFVIVWRYRQYTEGLNARKPKMIQFGANDLDNIFGQ